MYPFLSGNWKTLVLLGVKEVDGNEQSPQQTPGTSRCFLFLLNFRFHGEIRSNPRLRPHGTGRFTYVYMIGGFLRGWHVQEVGVYLGEPIRIPREDWRNVTGGLGESPPPHR